MGDETSLSYDAGVFHKFGKTLSVRAAANYIDTHNYFVTNGNSIYYSLSYTYTIDHLKYFGYEGEFNWAPFEKLAVFGNFSHLKDSYSKAANLPVAELLELPPMNKGKLSIRYSLPLEMRFLSDFKFIGKRGTEGGYTLSRYALGDFSLEKSVASKMSFSFFVNNMWDETYDQVYGFPSPGLTYGVRLKMNSASSPFSH